MKTISIRQPWASLIIAGPKRIENRCRNISGSYRGPVLIHASASKQGGDGSDAWCFMAERKLMTKELDALICSMRDLRRGGIIGMATITDIILASDDPWFTGPVGIVLSNVQPLPFMPCKGKLGLFEVTYPSQ